MKLHIKNIGKLSHAEIEINSISVIAGENNSGKSTISKVLYSLFNSFYQIDKKVNSLKAEAFLRLLERELYRRDEENTVDDSRFYNRRFPLKYLSDVHKIAKQEFHDFSSLFEEVKNYLVDINLDDALIRIFDDEKFNLKSREIFESDAAFWKEEIISKSLQRLFDGQLNNLFIEDKALINFWAGKEHVNLEIKENQVQHISNAIDFYSQVIYLDDPYIIDRLDLPSRYQNTGIKYRDDVLDFLRDELEENMNHEILIEKQVDKILQNIPSIKMGSIVKERSTYTYKDASLTEGIKLSNLSSGMKTFAIINSLLRKGHLKTNGTLILDEPEVHLHPQWQLILAEMIVLIQKEFNMHILITTHSPYFIEAIEVFSKKHERKGVRFYKTFVDQNSTYTLEVTNNLKEIYEQMYHPLETLESLREDLEHEQCE